MKRPNRTLSIFTLSALDVLAVATGTFVLLVVLLMPYYQKSFDAQAEIEEVRVETANATVKAEALQQAAARDLAAAAEARAEAARLRSAAAELEGAASNRQEGRPADRRRRTTQGC